MKLVALKPVPVSYVADSDDPSRYLRGKRLSFLLVRVEAEDGTAGYGEVCDSFCCNYPASVSAVIEEAIAPLIVGKSLGSVDDSVSDARRATRRRLGDHGIVVQALSGVEIALWDLKGKLAGKPVYELLGAPPSDVPVYASGSFLDEGGVEWHARYFEPLLQRGVKAIKVRLGADYQPQLQTLDELCRALGDGVRIMVDGNEFFTLNQALEIARTLADLNVYFFEEPIAQCEREAIATLVRRSPVPIAYGEHLFLVHDFADCLQHRRANYLQPDASICGGIGEGLRIAEHARSHGIAVAPHSAAGAVSLAANLHMAAAMGTVEMLEYSFPLAHFWQEMASPGFDFSDIHNGRISLPQGPGLGVTPRDALSHNQRSTAFQRSAS
jgi:D-galactarolactone cycloisomerase